MGADKSLLPGRRGPWALGVALALRDAGVEDVWFVGGDRDQLSALGPHLPDAEPGAGPLVALATLAGHRPGRSLVVCACDLPDLDGGALGPLLDAVDDGAEAAVPEVGGRPAWSVLALAPSAAEHVRIAAAAGTRSFHEGLLGVEVTRLHLPSAPFLDVDGPLGPPVHGSEG